MSGLIAPASWSERPARSRAENRITQVGRLAGVSFTNPGSDTSSLAGLIASLSLLGAVAQAWGLVDRMAICPSG
jgi:hypothetical protein